MYEKLIDKLIDLGYQVEIDDSEGYQGIFLPDYQIDIIVDEENVIINNPDDNEPVATQTIDDTVSYINDLTQSEKMENALEDNHYNYKQESARYFEVGNDKIKIIDGRFYLYGEDGERNVFIDVPSVIGALQSKFLGED